MQNSSIGLKVSANLILTASCSARSFTKLPGGLPQQTFERKPLKSGRIPSSGCIQPFVGIFFLKRAQLLELDADNWIGQ
jgi:hypothetical protein